MDSEHGKLGIPIAHCRPWVKVVAEECAATHTKMGAHMSVYFTAMCDGVPTLVRHVTQLESQEWIVREKLGTLS